MAGEQYAELALTALAGTIATLYPARLRAVETALGLATGALPDPIAVIKTAVPTDNRGPIVFVFPERFDFPTAGQRQKIAHVECGIAIQLVGDADLEALELAVVRYLSAMIELIRLNPTLGGAVAAAFVRSGEADAAFERDRTATKAVWKVDATVIVQS